jgi:signal transduction histidine kinase
MWAIFRSNRPVLVSVVAIGIPLLVLLAFQWTTLAESERATERLLRLASAELAEAVARRVRDDFTGTFVLLLEPIERARVRRLDLTQIRDQLRSRDHLPYFVDGVFLGVTRQGAAKTYYFPGSVQDGGVSFADATSAETVVFHRGLAPRIWREAHHATASRQPVSVWAQDEAGARYHVLVQPINDLRDRSRLEAVLGLTVSHRRLRDVYFPGIVTQVVDWHRTSLRELPAAPVVSIFDEQGVEIYRSGRSLERTYESESTVPFTFVDTQRFREWRTRPPTNATYLRIRTAYDSASVEELVAGRGRNERQLRGVTTLLVLLGLVLTAASTYREVRLARMKLDFLSRLSHDLQTPLANIRLFADTLKSRPDLSPERTQRYHEIVSSHAMRLAHRIEGILDFARIEAGVRTYPMERVDLKAVARSAFDSYEYELAQAGFKRELVLPVEDLTITGNADALEQLFANLIDNAVKYSEHDRALRITLALSENAVRVDVTDKGIGIPRAEQKKIFRKFYRVQRPAGSPTGSGLGLAIVTHIVGAHNGRIHCSSEPGAGTTFTIHFPRSVERSADDRETDPRDRRRSGSRAWTERQS